MAQLSPHSRGRRCLCRNRQPFDTLTTRVYDTQKDMKSADLIRELQDAGWVVDRVRGSHHVLKHPGRSGHITVPHPKKDLGIGLVRAIRKAAGLL